MRRRSVCLLALSVAGFAGAPGAHADGFESRCLFLLAAQIPDQARVVATSVTPGGPERIYGERVRSIIIDLSMVLGDRKFAEQFECWHDNHSITVKILPAAL